jgi:hypothetical protein
VSALDLSQPGVLEGPIEHAGLVIDATGSGRVVWEWPDFAWLWRAMVSSGPMQAVMRVVGRDKVRAAMQDAVQPFRMNGHGYRMVNWVRYVAAAR